MNNTDLIVNLEGLIKRYIDDKDVVKELIKNIEPSKVKYVLGEIDKYRSKEYSSGDKDLLKDIYFYYC